MKIIFTYKYLIFTKKDLMTNKRYAMAVRLKDEKKDFYIKNHADVWPEILSELKKIKIKNYSIFLKEGFMFGYLEYDGDNFDLDMAEMSKIAIVDILSRTVQYKLSIGEHSFLFAFL